MSQWQVVTILGLVAFCGAALLFLSAPGRLRSARGWLQTLGATALIISIYLIIGASSWVGPIDELQQIIELMRQNPPAIEENTEE